MKACVNSLNLEKKEKPKQTNPKILGEHLLISYINYPSTKQKQISQDLG